MNSNKVLNDSVNARYLNYEEIANLFIPNQQYIDLVKPNHSLLMGPRGSGKTTLLKMLTTPAQHYANANERLRNLQPPAFYSIYVPTDIQWKKQIDDFKIEFLQKPKFSSVITRLIVTTNVLISLCDTFINLLEFKESSENDFKFEADLAVLLIDDWKISKPISANLHSIKHSLISRLANINSHIRKVRINDIVDEKIDMPEFYYDNYIDLVTAGCSAFETIFKQDQYFSKRGFKWAICFDELEIAPEWLQIELLYLLRSTASQNIFFKLTMVPLVNLSSNNSLSNLQARENQDFLIIRTWTYSAESLADWKDFSRRLIQDKFKRKFGERINPIGLLGPDSLDLNIAQTFKNEATFEQKKGYSSGSTIWYLFKEAARADITFREFLKNKGINPANPIPERDKQEDEIFRKIKPLVVHRFQFQNTTLIGRKRSRKNAALYYGMPFLSEFCEGNPRALIGLIDQVIAIIQRNKGKTDRIPIEVQSRLIYTFSRQYLESIFNHPDSNVPYLNKYINLGSLLNRIGIYFHERIIDGEFNMDPANCFEIDRDIPESIIDLLTVAMHLGAIIYLDPQESITKNGMVGKKFRLSYFLFPRYELPTVTYKEVQLSKILRKGTEKIDQLLLFDSK